MQPAGKPVRRLLLPLMFIAALAQASVPAALAHASMNDGQGLRCIYGSTQPDHDLAAPAIDFDAITDPELKAALEALNPKDYSHGVVGDDCSAALIYAIDRPRVAFLEALQSRLVIEIRSHSILLAQAGTRTRSRDPPLS